MTLKHWVGPQKREIQESTIRELKAAGQGAAVRTLKELKQNKRHIRGTKGRSFVINSGIITVKQVVSTRAQIDSGCTSSCINEGFVRSNRIPTRKSPITIPMFNADGTPNDLGKITHFVDTKLCIGKHREDIQLAVVKLGTTPIFLGHDWLKKHNPSVDWNLGGLAFDRCPKSCGYIQEDFTMDKDIEPPPPYHSLEGGD